MIIVLYNVIVSPHQLPLAMEIKAKLKGSHDSLYYIYTDQLPVDAKERGWDWNGDEQWVLSVIKNREKAEGLLKNCDVLISGIRDTGLFGARQGNGRVTYYMSERWFKPPFGMLRMLHPKYIAMACRVVDLIKRSTSFIYLPIGIHAAKDMARLCGLLAGDLRCLFRGPELDFENMPGGRIWLKNGGNDKKCCLDKMRMWGYFVEPSQLTNSKLTHSPTLNSPTPNSSTLKVLWVGRFLKLKRVDTIIRAVGELATHSFTHPLTHSQLSLDIYGTGPEEKRLKKLAAKYGDCINFYPPVPISDVRKLMREHDIYVLSSNAYEGWGAVVSEALEEGMEVIGTQDAGSSATLLPQSRQFRSGDYKAIARLIRKIANGGLKSCDGRVWRVHAAAKSLISLSQGFINE